MPRGGSAARRASDRSAFAFVCACAAPDAAARARIEPFLDCGLVAAIAHRHQVVPLVVAAFRRSAVQIAPELAAFHDPIAPLRAAREAIRLRALLAAAGIESIFLKGSALAMLAYGSLENRQFSDIDVLVRPSDASRAAMLLSEAPHPSSDRAAEALAERVTRLAPFAKDIALRTRDSASGSDHVVELHWRLTDNPYETSLWDREGIQWVELAPGATLPTLATEALFAYLCAHGAAHLWARLRWLADVAALLAREADGGDRLWRGAVARGQGRSAASAFLLSQRYFGAAVPPAFSRPASIRLALLLAGSRRVIEAGGGTTELARTRWRGWAETSAKLLLVASLGDLAGWIMRLLFSVADDDDVATSRLWYVAHPLQRIPKLLARRRRRRLHAAAALSPSRDASAR